jgi:hypothetical protein
MPELSGPELEEQATHVSRHEINKRREREANIINKNLATLPFFPNHIFDRSQQAVSAVIIKDFAVGHFSRHTE